MTDVERDPAVRGKTIRLTWTDGPTKGKTHEHVFHQDGTVEWRDAHGSEAGKAEGQQQKTPGAKEKPEYAAMKVADDIYLVSYLAPSGFALTVVLNFRDRGVVGVASGGKEWHPLRGTLELVGKAGK